MKRPVIDTYPRYECMYRFEIGVKGTNVKVIGGY